MANDKTIEMSVVLQVRVPQWPNYVLVNTIGDGESKIDVGQLNAEQIEVLCQSFRDHCASRKPF